MKWPAMAAVGAGAVVATVVMGWGPFSRSG